MPKHDANSRAETIVESAGAKWMARIVMPIAGTIIVGLAAVVLNNLQTTIQSIEKDRKDATVQQWQAIQRLTNSVGEIVVKLGITEVKLEATKVRSDEADIRQAQQILETNKRLDAIDQRLNHRP